MAVKRKRRGRTRGDQNPPITNRLYWSPWATRLRALVTRFMTPREITSLRLGDIDTRQVIAFSETQGLRYRGGMWSWP